MAQDPHDKHRELLEEITSLKNRIMELEQSEKRYAHMASFPNLAPVCILEIDRAKQVIFCNPAMQSVIDNTGIDDPSIFIPEDIWESFSKGESITKHEHVREIRIKDLFFIEYIFLVAEFGSLCIYATDITEHRKIKERLKKRDEMFKSLFDAVPETMILIDTEGTVLLSNTVVAQRLGKTITELEGTCIYDLFPPDVANYRKQHYDRVVLTGEPLYFKDSRLERYFEQYCYPVFNEDKKVSGVIVFAYETTERNKAERAFLAEKGFSEAILEAMPGVFYCFDDHLHFKKWNRNFEAVTGYSAEELAKITPLDLFEGEGKRLAEKRIGEVFEKGESTLEADLVSKDGGKTPYFFTGKRVTINNKQHLIGMGVDITERKQAEKALNKSQNLLSSTFNAMQDMLIVLDKDLRVVMSNWKDHDYVSQQERDGNPYCYKTIMHKDTPCEPCHALEVFATGKIKTLEHVNLVDGKTREIRVYPILDDSGNVAMVTEHVRDITYKKQAEEKLRKSEEKYRNLFHNAVEGIYQSTPEGRLITANPAFAKMLGFDSADEAIQNLTDVKHQVYVNPEDREAVQQKVKQYGSVSSFETQFYRKDRTKIWVSFSINGVYDKKGILQYYEGMVEDITSKKKAEQKLLFTKMRQDALLEIYQMTDATIDEITGFVVEECLKLTNSELAFVGYIDEDETIMHTHLWSRKAMDICSVDGKPVKFPLAKGGLWAEAIRQKKPVIVENYSDPNPYKKGCPEGHVNLTSFMSIPLIKRNHVVIVAGLANKKEPYDESDVIQISLLLEGLWNFMQSRKAEEEIRSSEEKYRSIFDNAVEGIFQTTPEGKFLSINRSFAKLVGYESPEEMMEGVADLGHQLYVNPEDREQFKKLIEEHGFIKNYEVQQYRKDGSTIWVLINARCVHDEHGVLMYYEGTFEDITKRKLAEVSLQQTLEKLRKSLAGTIQAMSLTVETRDPYTAGHQRHVSNLARTIAQEMGLSNDTVDNIRMAGIIHDIGKISVPAELLVKPTKLTDIEMGLIKVHSQSGYDILKDVELPYPIADVVLQHHERLDGSGYPKGLKGDQILLETKILSVADVTEAIATHRPYRPALGINVALEEIEKNKGVLYDEMVVEVCLKLFREKGFSFE